MSTYKLTYFNIRARAEISRLLFAVAEVPYEDIRVEFSRWPDLKSSAPFGQLPLLEVDGVTLCQSKAIARFIANRFGLTGKNEMEKFRGDMIVDCFDDLIKPSLDYFHEKDKIKQEELQTKFVKETLPNAWLMLEKLLTANNDGNGYFVGDSLTWVDVAFIDLCSWLTSILLFVPLDSTPKLKALRERVEAHPKIAEWIKKRPANDF